MKLATILIAVAATGLHTTSASATDYKVQRTLQLSAPSTEVWNIIGDYCDIDDWHPALSGCTLKVIDGSLHRSLTTVDGAVYLEKRIAVDPGLSYTYKLVEPDLPIENFTATFSIEPLNGSLISWSARFSSADPTMEAEISDMIDAGLSAIQNQLAQ